jgi:hypothetical protein
MSPHAHLIDFFLILHVDDSRPFLQSAFLHALHDLAGLHGLPPFRTLHFEGFLSFIKVLADLPGPHKKGSQVAFARLNVMSRSFFKVGNLFTTLPNLPGILFGLLFEVSHSRFRFVHGDLGRRDVSLPDFDQSIHSMKGFSGVVHRLSHQRVQRVLRGAELTRLLGSLS